jgi:DNA-binding CsgD family transcriptional regulator
MQQALKKAKGSAFLTINPTNPLTNKDPKVQQFLKIINPLSPRERQCLQLFKEGKSAQATAAILGISRRTVEFYFESIKNKLRCRTKAELLHYRVD